MPIRKRFSATKEVDGRLLSIDFTTVTYKGDGWTEPDDTEMHDEVYYLDGVPVELEDLPEEMQEMCYGLSATAQQIPWNFGPPDDYLERERDVEVPDP